jgi:thioredoxin reductase
VGSAAPVPADLAIVGAGPAGLYAAYCAGFRGLSTVVLDSLEEVGGQLTALYPEKPILDVAGFPSITARDLVARCREQADTHAPTYLLGHTVESLVRSEDGGFRLGTAAGTEVHARAVILTSGIGSFTPRPLPAAEGWHGRGVVHFVRELATMRGLDVVIVGGGDSAVDWALTLRGVARSIVLVHRRDGFRAHEASVTALRSSEVRLLVPCEVERIEGGERVERVVVRTVGTGELTTVPAQAVVAALGFTADLGPLAEWGFEQDGRALIVDSRMATSVPGVFAAGDVATYPGMVPLISVAFGEAAIAVNNAATWLDPSARLAPGHSSATAG